MTIAFGSGIPEPQPAAPTRARLLASAPTNPHGPLPEDDQYGHFYPDHLNSAGRNSNQQERLACLLRSLEIDSVDELPPGAHNVRDVVVGLASMEDAKLSELLRAIDRAKRAYAKRANGPRRRK